MRKIAEGEFQTRSVTAEGEEVFYRIYELATKETSYGTVRTIVFWADDGRQIPILTNNPYMKAEQMVYLLQRRWREENCFKYMIEHFGIDLLTTYKTEEAPDKEIKRVNPQRRDMNQQIAETKKELAGLQSELAQKFLKAQSDGKQTIEEFLEQETELNCAIKAAEVKLAQLTWQRDETPTKVTINLKDDHVIIAQKRRLLINAVKAMNYNAEKWFQMQFKTVHAKADETLSLVRSLWQQPGQVRRHSHQLELKLKALDLQVMQRSLASVLRKLQESNQLRLPDGRRIKIVWEAGV
jgi:hypothetical protein